MFSPTGNAFYAMYNKKNLQKTLVNFVWIQTKKVHYTAMTEMYLESIEYLWNIWQNQGRNNEKKYRHNVSFFEIFSRKGIFWKYSINEVISQSF